LKDELPDIELHFGCICFRDPIDSVNDKHEHMDFSADIEKLAVFLEPITATGGFFKKKSKCFFLFRWGF
jgi:hypothetical protein